MSPDELARGFELIPEGAEKYAYIIELGKKLPPYPEEERTDANLAAGCASSVWMRMRCDGDGRWHFSFDSNAAIVKGLLYIIMTLLNGKTSYEIKNIDILEIFGKIGFANHLTAQRMSGLASIVEKIKETAAKSD
jgi:cysteine desulfuration protein SufE